MRSMHPSKKVLFSKSKKLEGKRISLGITSSVAAVETIALARELIRHGAEIQPFMTKETTKIIAPEAIEFATGNKPILELGGEVEHITFCSSDLLLIAPCTANTISKIALGICDNALTSLAFSSLGAGIKIIIAPAMHETMYKNQILRENMKKLADYGVEFIEPRIEEGSAKLQKIPEIVSNVIRALGKKDFKGKKILVIGGATREKIDEIRFITNTATGISAVEIAKEGYERGAEVEVWAPDNIDLPSYIKKRNFGDLSDLLRIVKNAKSFDIVLVPAGITDFIVKKTGGKISSDKELILKLEPAPKFISKLRKIAKGYIVGYKLEAGISREELIKRGFDFLRKNNLQLVVANRIEDVEKDRNKVELIDRDGEAITIEGKKSLIATELLNKVIKDLK
ncbi:MAG: bifunctional phosphopantothenoylcysteine decarboxylase/phosphopantothenate--cysteine ligase CoaBC [Candidatus Thermoplasmatota archaeon]